MRDDEFISQMIGKPWVDRACSMQQVDCWGLVVLFYAMCRGRNIEHNNYYHLGVGFNNCHDSEIVFWDKVEKPVDGGMFVAYMGAHPLHVGLTFGPDGLHARAANSHVRRDRIRTIQKVFTKVEFYQYANDKS